MINGRLTTRIIQLKFNSIHSSNNKILCINTIYRYISIIYEYIIDPHNNQFPVGRIVQVLNCLSTSPASLRSKFESCSGLRSLRLGRYYLVLIRARVIHQNIITIWAASCQKGPDDVFCPFLVLSFFAHFIPQLT